MIGEDLILCHLPSAAGLGGSTGVTFAHGASSGAEGSAHGTEYGRLGEGGAEHVDVVGGFRGELFLLLKRKRKRRKWDVEEGRLRL